MCELGGLFEGSDGIGIFLDCGALKMNVGMIMPGADGTFFLNVAIFPDMSLEGIEAGGFMDSFDSFDSALIAARQFLNSKRR